MDIALFSPSSLFAGDDDSSTDEETKETKQSYVERKHSFSGMELFIREFSFHQLNANLLWPGTFAFAEWLVQHKSHIEGRRCIELGSGTGALAVFLRKQFNLDITTSDYSDEEIEENIAQNCWANGITPALPHIKHSWGDTFPTADPDWDLVIASDILLYVKQYSNLIKTLSFLLKSYKPKNDKVVTANEQNGGRYMELPRPAFLMSWRRRIGKEDESFFFNGCEAAGLEVEHLGSRVYCIKCRDPQSKDQIDLMAGWCDFHLKKSAIGFWQFRCHGIYNRVMCVCIDFNQRNLKSHRQLMLCHNGCLNSGFYFARSDASTIAAMEKVVKHAASSGLSEQRSFYDTLCGEGGSHHVGDDRCVEPETNLTVNFLDRDLFLNGAYLDIWKKHNVKETYAKIGCRVLHNNWISGRMKMER